MRFDQIEPQLNAIFDQTMVQLGRVQESLRKVEESQAVTRADIARLDR